MKHNIVYGFWLITSSYPSICGSVDTKRLHLVREENGKLTTYVVKENAPKKTIHFSDERFYNWLSTRACDNYYRFEGCNIKRITKDEIAIIMGEGQEN